MLVRQGAIYHFRKRVPAALQAALKKREVWVSLRTTCLRTARSRAAALYAVTESWPGKFGQVVEWISCLTAAMMPRITEAAVHQLLQGNG